MDLVKEKVKAIKKNIKNDQIDQITYYKTASYQDIKKSELKYNMFTYLYYF